MGSYTYHVIGYGIERLQEDDSVKRYAYPCMNKREMAQAVIKAEKHGDVIMGRYSQTGTGKRMLNGNEEEIAGNVSLPKLVMCPKCHGTGCGICNFCGYTTKAWLKGFQGWQLEPERK